MPGTDVAVTTLAGPPATTVIPEAIAYIAALTERGPTLTSPHGKSADGQSVGLPYVELTSLADFIRQCGDPQAYGWGYHSARVFFEEQNGALMRLVRPVGADATRGFLQVMDRADSPAATLKFWAADEGAWSARVSIEIRDGLIAGTYDVVVAYDGVAQEAFKGLPSPAAAPAAVNGNSRYVTVTVLSDATVAPANNPAVAGPTALSAGVDDRGTLAPADYVAACTAAFPVELGAGIVAIPGFSADQIGDGLKAHAAAVGRGFVVAPPVASSETDAKLGALALLDSNNGPGRRGRFVWPWVGYTDETGVAYTVPPEPFYMAGRARAILSGGVWQAAAGTVTRARFVDYLEQSVGKAVGDDLDAAHVTVIRRFANRPELYGIRPLSTDDAWALVKFSDLIDKISADLPVVTHDLEWGTIDELGAYFAKLTGRIKAYLGPLAAAGAFYAKVDPGNPANLIDPGYTIDTSAAVNPLEQIAQRITTADVMVRPAETAVEIHINLAKAAVTA